MVESLGLRAIERFAGTNTKGKLMNTIPDLIPLYDSRPGLRTLLQVEVREAVVSPASAPDAQIPTSESQPILDFVASTATLDRYHEIIEPAGWRLDSYRKNPVFQNAHNYGDILFTLGRAVSTEVRNIDGRQALFQRIQFATEVNPVARIAHGLYKGGFLNAVSVGFIPLRWEDGGKERGAESEEQGADPASSDSGATSRGAAPRRRYLEQELLEVSAVAIPANPDALALGVKAGAVARSDLREAMELFRALAGAGEAPPPYPPSLRSYGEAGVGSYNNQWLDFARELRRVMQKA